MASWCRRYILDNFNFWIGSLTMNDNINVYPIENGYIVEIFRAHLSRKERWYCISPEEVAERVTRLLLAE